MPGSATYSRCSTARAVPEEPRAAIRVRRRRVRIIGMSSEEGKVRHDGLMMPRRPGESEPRCGPLVPFPLEGEGVGTTVHNAFVVARNPIAAAIGARSNKDMRRFI